MIKAYYANCSASTITTRMFISEHDDFYLEVGSGHRFYKGTGGHFNSFEKAQDYLIKKLMQEKGFALSRYNSKIKQIESYITRVQQQSPEDE